MASYGTKTLTRLDIIVRSSIEAKDWLLEP